MTAQAPSPSWLDRIQVVLISTSHAGNIGSVARAMKNMGLSRLVLVAPQVAIDDKARATAKHAVDLLDRARICATLDEALADSVAVWATSARRRDVNLPVVDARAAATAMREVVHAAEPSDRVSLLFGAERTGLTNAELQAAGTMIEITANPDYPVLNLAQAVQIVSYELQMASRSEPAAGITSEPPARIEALDNWLARLDAALCDRAFFGTEIDVAGRQRPDARARERLMGRVRLMLNRARPSANELAILHGMLTALARGPENETVGTAADPKTH